MKKPSKNIVIILGLGIISFCLFFPVGILERQTKYPLIFVLLIVGIFGGSLLFLISGLMGLATIIAFIGLIINLIIQRYKTK